MTTHMRLAYEDTTHRYIVGIFNGFDVDDYYINASNYDDAYNIGMTIGEVYTIIELQRRNNYVKKIKRQMYVRVRLDS